MLTWEINRHLETEKNYTSFFSVIRPFYCTDNGFKRTVMTSLNFIAMCIDLSQEDEGKRAGKKL